MRVGDSLPSREKLQRIPGIRLDSIKLHHGKAMTHDIKSKSFLSMHPKQPFALPLCNILDENCSCIIARAFIYHSHSRSGSYTPTLQFPHEHSQHLFRESFEKLRPCARVLLFLKSLTTVTSWLSLITASIASYLRLRSCSLGSASRLAPSPFSPSARALWIRFFVVFAA